MKTKHTQGKWDWAITTKSSNIYIEHPYVHCDGMVIFNSALLTKVSTRKLQPMEAEEAEANAKLIAAAPEMLEALIIAEQQVNYLVRQFDTGQSKSLFKIRKTIQKATS